MLDASHSYVLCVCRGICPGYNCAQIEQEVQNETKAERRLQHPSAGRAHSGKEDLACGEGLRVEQGGTGSRVGSQVVRCLRPVHITSRSQMNKTRSQTIHGARQAHTFAHYKRASSPFAISS